MISSPRLILSSLALALIALLTLGAALSPDQTRYGKSLIRLEGRPYPFQVKDAAARMATEKALADDGMDARWISCADVNGAPFIKNPFLPGADIATDENEKILRDWVTDIHKTGMAAISWYPLAFCSTGWQQNPQWRQVSILPWAKDSKAEKMAVCFNSPYGQAMIDYCNYAIEKIGLDGIWFDGSVWTPIWERPIPLTCFCESCKAKFKAETGHDLPQKVDWNDAVYRQWIAWRYETFGAYIGKVAREIKAKHPDVVIAINHYHRPGIDWQTALPLNQYNADILTASEAHEPDTIDVTMRLCQAYGRNQSEVWRPVSEEGDIANSANTNLQHALNCYVAGGQPSFGGAPSTRTAQVTGIMSPIMKKIGPLAGGKVMPYVGMHVSQKTETFYFGRKVFTGLSNPFWVSITNWTSGFGKSRIAPDYIFDADFTPTKLATYKAFMMPLSISLTDSQIQTTLDYARKGGILILGSAAGQRDAQGMPNQSRLLERVLGYQADSISEPDNWIGSTAHVRETQTGKAYVIMGFHTPFELKDAAWESLVDSTDTPGNPKSVMACRTFGKGKVILMGIDPSQASSITAGAEGKTKIGVSTEAPASGKYSLKLEDSPDAPASYFPDFEFNIPSIERAQFAGGRMQCDLKIMPGAQAQVDIRSTWEPIFGPSISIGRDGKIWSENQEIVPVPTGKWFHLAIDWNFAPDNNSSATYRVTVTQPGSEPKTFAEFHAQGKGYSRADWIAIYGSGDKGAFYVDSIKIEGIAPGKPAQLAFAQDFESGDNLLNTQSIFEKILADQIARLAPPPVQITAPDFIRAGIYLAGGQQAYPKRARNRILVHLHNRNGKIGDFESKSGPVVSLFCKFPVHSAKSLLKGDSLTVQPENGGSRINIPSVGLYDVLELTR